MCSFKMSIDSEMISLAISNADYIQWMLDLQPQTKKNRTFALRKDPSIN